MSEKGEIVLSLTRKELETLIKVSRLMSNQTFIGNPFFKEIRDVQEVLYDKLEIVINQEEKEKGELIQAAARAGKGTTEVIRKMGALIGELGDVVGTLDDGEQSINMSPEEMDRINNMSKKDIQDEVESLDEFKEIPEGFTPIEKKPRKLTAEDMIPFEHVVYGTDMGNNESHYVTAVKYAMDGSKKEVSAEDWKKSRKLRPFENDEFIPKVGERCRFWDEDPEKHIDAVYAFTRPNGHHAAYLGNHDNFNDPKILEYRVVFYVNMSPIPKETERDIKVWSEWNIDLRKWYGICMTESGTCLYDGDDKGGHFDTRQEAEDKAREEGEKG